MPKRSKPFPLILFLSLLSSFVLIVLICSLLFLPQPVPSGDTTIDPTQIPDTYDPDDVVGWFDGRQVTPPVDLQIISEQPNKPTYVLGDSTLDKRIEVDLSTQTLTAFEGDAAVYHFPVSTGKWFHTPTGEFTTWAKFTYTKMSGGSKALRTYYYLPNVPYTMFFYNDEIPKHRGFAIHGAYWHSNFGQPMSHGCVNMHPQDARTVFEWADPELPDGKGSLVFGAENKPTKIIIFGQTPRS